MNARQSGGSAHEGIQRTGEWFGIGNEFTGVQVRKVWTRNGERLEVLVPTKNRSILLDAMQLEIIAAQEPEQFSWLFERQLGSDLRAEDASEGSE